MTGYIDTKHTGQAYSVGLSPIQLWPTVTRKARSSSFSATGLVRASCTRHTRLLQPKLAQETTWSVLVVTPAASHEHSSRQLKLLSSPKAWSWEAIRDFDGCATAQDSLASEAASALGILPETANISCVHTQRSLPRGHDSSSPTPAPATTCATPRTTTDPCSP